jgi:Pectate lyase superfamily protein
VGLEVFANDATAVVASGGTTAPSAGTVESWTLSGSTLPAVSSSATPLTQCYITDVANDTEKILVTNISGSTATVTRGSDGTTPVAHTAGFTVRQVVVRASLQAFQSPDWLDVVRQFGADPSGSTDSTTAILNAIGALPASGGVVYFPAGTYKLSGVITIGSGVTLRGDGAQTTILQQTSTSANAIFVTEVSTYVTDVTIEDLQVLGPSSGTGVGIYGSADSDTQGIFRLRIANVVVTSFGGNGIEIHNPILSVLDQVQSSFNSANGIYLLGVPVGTSCSLISCYTKSNGSRGYYLSNMVYSGLVGCAADFNQNGYVFNVCAGVTVSGCGAESQTVDEFVFSGGASNTMTGCWTYQNAHYALNVLGGESGLSVWGFTENGPVGGAVNSIITASGTTAFIANYTVATAVSFATGTASLTPAGVWNITSGSLTLSPNIPLTVNGNIDISGTGYGLEVKEGSNCKQGTAALVAGSKVVSNTAVTANSRIFLTSNADGGTPGWLRVSARTAGTSFTITSSSGSDTSTVAYEIFEPG